MAAAWHTDEQKKALKATADAMSAPGKGFLASDESAGQWLRAGHVEAKKIADTVENRAAYRSMLYTTPGLSEARAAAPAPPPRRRHPRSRRRRAARPHRLARAPLAPCSTSRA